MEQRYKVDYPAIARRVKEARRRAGLTQEQLAERSTFPPTRWPSWKTT